MASSPKTQLPFRLGDCIVQECQVVQTEEFCVIWALKAIYRFFVPAGL